MCLNVQKVMDCGHWKGETVLYRCARSKQVGNPCVTRSFRFHQINRKCKICEETDLKQIKQAANFRRLERSQVVDNDIANGERELGLPVHKLEFEIFYLSTQRQVSQGSGDFNIHGLAACFDCRIMTTKGFQQTSYGLNPLQARMSPFRTLVKQYVQLDAIFNLAVSVISTWAYSFDTTRFGEAIGNLLSIVQDNPRQLVFVLFIVMAFDIGVLHRLRDILELAILSTKETLRCEISELAINPGEVTSLDEFHLGNIITRLSVLNDVLEVVAGLIRQKSSLQGQGLNSFEMNALVHIWSNRIGSPPSGVSNLSPLERQCQTGNFPNTKTRKSGDSPENEQTLRRGL